MFRHFFGVEYPFGTLGLVLISAGVVGGVCLVELWFRVLPLPFVLTPEIEVLAVVFAIVTALIGPGEAPLR